MTDNSNNNPDLLQTPNPTTNPATDLESDTNMEMLMANLSIVREQTQELEAAIAGLEDRLRLASGTGEVTAQAQAATSHVREVQARLHASQISTLREVPEPPRRGRPPRGSTPPVYGRVEAALAGHSMSVTQIARITGISVGKVADELKNLRKQERVANMGSVDSPLWTLRMGDHTSTRELTAEVKRLIMEKPMSTHELIEVTGARLSRVSGALVHLQRTEQQLLNLGTARRAKWFLVRPDVVLAKLQPKGGNG